MVADSTGWPGRQSRLVLSGALLLAALLAGQPPNPSAAAETGGTAGICRVAWSEERLGPFDQGAFRLGTGSAARPVDLRLPEAGAMRERALAVLAALAGEAARVGIVGEADRWERAPAILRIGTERPVDVAELLVGEGLALVDAGPREELCRSDLLVVEDAARRARRGLWATPDAVLRARDADSLGAAAGRFVLVEGRVVSVGVRRERTYLNFGRDWSRDFAVTLPRRTWGTLLARGHDADSLRGATVRVRGVVEMRRAPSLDVVAADMLEVLAPPPPRSTRPAREDHARDDHP